MTSPLSQLNFQNMNEKEQMTEEDQRLTLAYENLEEMPRTLVNSFGSFVRILDISHNNFRNVSFLHQFHNLSSLIMDHNKIDSATIFPSLKSLRLLWLNHNHIKQLYPFVHNLYNSFPRLQHISLMGNEVAPVCVHEAMFYQHLQYRLFIVSWFPELVHLDDRTVTVDEHTEARRLYKRPLTERFPYRESLKKLCSSVTASVQHILQKRNIHPERSNNFI